MPSMNGILQVIHAGLLGTALLSPLHAQEYVRWVANLGDTKLSEAAERSLLAMGDKALRPLAEQLEQWDSSTPDGRKRCRALLRIISLLGEKAESLGSIVKQCGMDNSTHLIPEIIDTLADLEPYANDKKWHNLFHHGITGADDLKGRAMASFVRLTARQAMRKRETFDDLRNELAKDRFGTREVAAELMGKLGDKAAIDLLHQRLLDRKTQPKAWDQLRHNGFIVAMQDQFALRAGEALIKLAPSDPRAAIGYANRALHHPHASVRLDALRQMAQLGPASSDAIPELLALAKSSDAKMAAEALKLLGMAGPKVGDHLATIDQLALGQQQGAAPRIAKGLAARLRAMGAKEPADDPEAKQLARKLATLIKTIDDEAKQDVRDDIAANPLSWDLLMDRFRVDRNKTPDVVFDLLVRTSWSRSEKERDKVRHCVALIGGDRWQASMMSTSSGGPGLKPIHRLTYARLLVDPSLKAPDLAELLTDENPIVRLVASQELRKRTQDWAPQTEHHEAVRDKLLKAATSKHPTDLKLDLGRRNKQTVKVKATKQVQTAAAEALAAYVVPSDRAGALMTAVLRSEHEAVIAKALTTWASEKVRKQLEKASADKREAVAVAAKAALARLGAQ